MRNTIARALGFLAALTPANHDATSAPSPSPRSLCRAPEMVLFTCGIRTKVVSICGQGERNAVYRFGRPGRVELEVSDLHYAEQAFSGGGETQVYANTPTHRYLVYDRIVRTSFDNGRHDPQAESGVVVQRGNQTISSRHCGSPTAFDSSTRTVVPTGPYMPH